MSRTQDPRLPKGKPVSATSNTMGILSYLSRQSNPAKLSDISKGLGLNPSNCLNILHTLVREEFVSFNPDSKQYEIGVGILELSNNSSALQRDISAIRPLMEHVANQRGFTVALWRQVSRSHKVLVLAANPPGQARMHMSLGQRPLLFTGASGRVSAAFSRITERALHAQFKKVRWYQPITFEKFLQEVAETRERGWSVDIERLLPGIATVGVPVFDARGDLMMVCTAIMWISQYSAKFALETANDMLRLSRNISFVAPTL